MLDMRASQEVGFLLGVDTFHKEGQAAGQEVAAQSHQGALEDSHPQEPQDTDLARWLLQMSQTCWLPAKYTKQGLRHIDPQRPALCLSTFTSWSSAKALGKEPPQNHHYPSPPSPQHYVYLAPDAGTKRRAQHCLHPTMGQGERSGHRWRYTRSV